MEKSNSIIKYIFFPSIWIFTSSQTNLQSLHSRRMSKIKPKNLDTAREPLLQAGLQSPCTCVSWIGSHRSRQYRELNSGNKLRMVGIDVCVCVLCKLPVLSESHISQLKMRTIELS